MPVWHRSAGHEVGLHELEDTVVSPETAGIQTVCPKITTGKEVK